MEQEDNPTPIRKCEKCNKKTRKNLYLQRELKEWWCEDCYYDNHRNIKRRHN